MIWEDITIGCKYLEEIGVRGSSQSSDHHKDPQGTESYGPEQPWTHNGYECYYFHNINNYYIIISYLSYINHISIISINSRASLEWKMQPIVASGPIIAICSHKLEKLIISHPFVALHTRYLVCYRDIKCIGPVLISGSSWQIIIHSFPLFYFEYAYPYPILLGTHMN